MPGPALDSPSSEMSQSLEPLLLSQSLEPLRPERVRSVERDAVRQARHCERGGFNLKSLGTTPVIQKIKIK